MDALTLMDVDAVARAVGVTPRTVRNWRRSERRYPRHSQARAVLACVDAWIDDEAGPPLAHPRRIPLDGVPPAVGGGHRLAPRARVLDGGVELVDSPDKEVTVSGTAAGGRGLASPADVTLTLRDDEATADVNGDGSIGWQDGLLMYYAYNFEGTFRLEDDVGRRVRVLLRTLRGPGSPAANDAGYKAMLDNAWRLRPSS